MPSTEKEKMLAGKPYIAFDPELDAMRRHAFAAALKFNATGDPAHLADLFGRTFEGLKLLPPFHCDYGENIHLGRNVFINFNVGMLACAPIDIGDNCYIGPNVQLYTAIHPIDPEERRQGINLAKPIRIGADCWLGGGVIVLPGVDIGEGTTIGAGSVVTRSIPPRSVAAGTPCRVLRRLSSTTMNG